MSDWNTEPYESYQKVKKDRNFCLSEKQIDNIIEVLEEWNKVIESFIENFILLKQQKEAE